MGLTSKTGAAKLREDALWVMDRERGDELENELLTMFDNWHKQPEVYDDDLSRQIAASKYYILRYPVKLNWPKYGTKAIPPSSANSDPRELFHRLRGDKRDEVKSPPHQGRWRRMGTRFGEMIQDDLLFIEKHYERLIGEAPPFVPDRICIDDKRFPFWEDFAKKIHHVKHKGHDLYFLGQPDGILRYKDGSRIGLEIKTKQTTAAATSPFKMKGPKEDHKAQVTLYSLIFGVDEFLIMYGNLSKKDWEISEEDYAKTPDLRAFYVRVTEEDRLALLDKYADVMDAIKTNNPPPLDLSKWTFNNYKTACALSLTDEEYADIIDQVSRVNRSGVSAWMKEAYNLALKQIQEIREGHGL